MPSDDVCIKNRFESSKRHERTMAVERFKNKIATKDGTVKAVVLTKVGVVAI